MKKLHKILIVVAVALAGAIAGTVVMSDMVGESNVVVQAVGEDGKPMVETQVVDETTSQSNNVESVDININLPEFTKEEMEARMLRNFRHYGASTCIYLLVDISIFQQSGGINVWSMYDSGSAVQNIMLLATNAGLGTVAQAQAVVYPDIVRKGLGIPEDKLIALGIAIGYPDWDNPVNKEYREREPLNKVVTFYGFD